MNDPAIRLTEYSHGAGCGCKIAPNVLDEMLKSSLSFAPDPNLLVGNASRDDAAAYAIGGGQVVLSTTDFFMPIADDPFDFGRIAATNAISDIYAMGGKPIMAIAILGWPVDKLSPKVAAKVIDGGRSVCASAGIPLAGGHSIDAPEPIFGLAVTGLVTEENLKRNDTAKPGDALFLTKPLGVGILTTAQKQKKLRLEHANLAVDTMCILNDIGAELATLSCVTAVTDVTGFGLLGHLSEMCEGSNLTAEINFGAVPLLPSVHEYLKAGCIPGGTGRNYASYSHKIGALSETQKLLLCDPQTSGGLLVAVNDDKLNDVEHVFKEAELDLTPIGHLKPRTTGPYVEVI